MEMSDPGVTPLDSATAAVHELALDNQTVVRVLIHPAYTGPLAREAAYLLRLLAEQIDPTR